MNSRTKSLLEWFSNPEKIITYSKEKWKFRKFSLIVIIAGALLGFNFFFTNFVILLHVSMAMLIIGMFVIGMFMLAMFIYIYIILIWGLLKLYLSKDHDEIKTEEKEEEKEESIMITKQNLMSWIKVFSYCFLIPFSIYQCIIFAITVFLITLKLYYVAVYINTIIKYIVYVWILAVTLYSTRDLDKSQKYQINTLLLSSFFITYLVVAYLNFQGTILLAKWLMSML